MVQDLVCNLICTVQISSIVGLKLVLGEHLSCCLRSIIHHSTSSNLCIIRGEWGSRLARSLGIAHFGVRTTAKRYLSFKLSLLLARFLVLLLLISTSVLILIFLIIVGGMIASPDLCSFLKLLILVSILIEF